MTNWFDIADGYYEMLGDGTVRRKDSGRIVTPYANEHGYLRVHLYCGGVCIKRFVHRLVAAEKIGPCPPGKQVNHKDGNKLNNRWDNLEYVTPRENKKHAMLHGLVAIGSRNSHAKLTEEIVSQIRTSYIGKRGEILSLAKKYKVCRGTIDQILARKIWRAV